MEVVSQSGELNFHACQRSYGGQVDILVDINSNYTVDLARASIARLAEYRIGWVEEPLAPQDFDGYARLRQTSAVPIATGEALYTVFDFKRLLDAAQVRADASNAAPAAVRRLLAGAAHSRSR